ISGQRKRPFSHRTGCRKVFAPPAVAGGGVAYSTSGEARVRRRLGILGGGLAWAVVWVAAGLALTAFNGAMGGTRGVRGPYIAAGVSAVAALVAALAPEVPASGRFAGLRLSAASSGRFEETAVFLRLLPPRGAAQDIADLGRGQGLRLHA